MPDIQEQFKCINRKEYFERKIMELSDAVVIALVGLDNLQAASRPEDKNRIAEEVKRGMNLILE